MSLNLACPNLRLAAQSQPWLHAEKYWPRLSRAISEHPAPVTVLGLEALSWNAQELLRRAGGKPIRVASKSVRARSVIEAVLRLPGYRGVLAYTLAEALWLNETIDDILVGYPTTDRAAIAKLVSDERAASQITVMIDCVDHLDLIDSVMRPERRPTIRVCLDFDASLRHRVLGHIGVLRSPVRSARQLLELARAVIERPGFLLVGVMSYEAQIAGVADQPEGRPARGAMLRTIQRKSIAELRERRTTAISALRDFVALEFVNGGGTGSLERTANDPSVTELAAGSGLYGPHLFDHYRAFRPAPAAAFALDVTRRSQPASVTAYGGGWVASGPAAPDRLPRIVWPRDLKFAPREGAGEVQTPLCGAAADQLQIGDRVWLRHAKAGEIMEHTNEVYAVRVSDSGEPVSLRTYRGEGKCFS